MNLDHLTEEQKFELWLAALYYITANETRLQVTEIKINEAETRKWYNMGCTPYQCFRETWGMENDNE